MMQGQLKLKIKSIIIYNRGVLWLAGCASAAWMPHLPLQIFHIITQTVRISAQYRVRTLVAIPMTSLGPRNGLN